jgi:hypothetical protein
MARVRSLRAALGRHPSIRDNPVSLRALQRLFGSQPPSSVEALLVKMGPFVSGLDGFRFGNKYAYTGEQIEALRSRFRIATDLVVGAAVAQIRAILGGVRTHTLVYGTIGLPDLVIDAVVGEITTALAGEIIDSFAAAAILGDEYGRCGGMAFAGYDFYVARWLVDERLGTEPPDGGDLGNYIFARLLDSLDLNAGRFLDWIANLHFLPKISRLANIALGSALGSVGGPPGIAIGAVLGSELDVVNLGGAGVLLERSKAEWTKLKQRLDEEAAWPVGLIYGHSANPFDQHQLLAVGYQERGDGTGSIVAWDNSSPGNNTSLDLDFRGEHLQIGGWKHPLRGFFLEDYAPKVPPASLRLP